MLASEENLEEFEEGMRRIPVQNIFEESFDNLYLPPHRDFDEVMAEFNADMKMYHSEEKEIEEIEEEKENCEEN